MSCQATVSVLGLALILQAMPSAALAQSTPSTVPRIGVLSGARAPETTGCTGRLRRGLSALGYVEGQDSAGHDLE